MKQQYRELRQEQLARTWSVFKNANLTRPRSGWLRAIREEVQGLTFRDVGEALGVARQTVAAFEKSEADNTITLKNLRAVAEVMGFDLVYALVPKAETATDADRQNARAEAEARVRAVEHSMSLEAQASGNVEGKIAKETKKVLEARQA
jgi:predicted DNA-binding mobile mystery protein A